MIQIKNKIECLIYLKLQLFSFPSFSLLDEKKLIIINESPLELSKG